MCLIINRGYRMQNFISSLPCIYYMHYDVLRWILISVTVEDVISTQDCLFYFSIHFLSAIRSVIIESLPFFSDLFCVNCAFICSVSELLIFEIKNWRKILYTYSSIFITFIIVLKLIKHKYHIIISFSFYLFSVLKGLGVQVFSSL